MRIDEVDDEQIPHHGRLIDDLDQLQAELEAHIAKKSHNPKKL